MKARFALFALLAASAASAADVTDVRVKALDGFGGDASFVASRCQVKAGRPYDPVTVTRDVTSLKDSGEFEEISADARRVAGGVEVTYFVKRKMRYLAPIVVKGNDALGASKISDEAGLKDGYLYGESDLAAAEARIRRAYLKKDYPDAKVSVSTEIVAGNDVTVTVTVDEGVRQKVSGWAFEGAEHAVEPSLWSKMRPGAAMDDAFFDVAELHEACGDLPWWNVMGWFAEDPVTEDQLAQCREKVAEVYRNRGYLDVSVAGPRRAPDGEGRVRLVFDVSEGVQYRVGSTRVEGVTRYPAEAVAAKSALPAAGSVAGQKALDDAAHRVEVAVGSGDSGLADSRVEVRRLPTAAPAVVDVVFKVREGVPVVINEVKIRGNDYTKDKVIRREIALGPGDRMLADRAERSQKRLENLDYFERVRYFLEPAGRAPAADGSEYRDLVYEVAEKNTGSFMVGIGASSVDSVYVSAEVNQNNFDLFAPSKLFRGAGQKGRAYVAWGPRYQSAELGFAEPHLFGRTLELSVDVYRRLRWYDEYDLIRTGAGASLAYPVKFWPTWEPFGRFSVGLSGEYIQFDDVEDGTYSFGSRTGQLFQEEKREFDKAVEPVVHFAWSRDARDNVRIPTRGYRTRVFLDVAPAGDNQYWRIGLNHRGYYNVWRRLLDADVDHVFMWGLRAETVDAISGDLPIYNRMFLGGPKSIRGIEYRNVAPLARRVGDDEYAPWGGQTLFCMNFEYTVPVVKMLRFAVFSDLGSVGEDVFDLDFSSTFAWTVGCGFRLDIPMFPIRLDFAAPIKEPDHAEKEVFSFTVGYDF